MNLSAGTLDMASSTGGSIFELVGNYNQTGGTFTQTVRERRQQYIFREAMPHMFNPVVGYQYIYQLCRFNWRFVDVNE